MAKQKETPAPALNAATAELVQALVQAIQLTKPVEKKTAVNRKPGSPWDPKDGSKKLKLKRKMYQHSIPIDPDFIDNETIDLLNKLKLGRFCEGVIKVYRRKDSGIDIDYPVKTASQRIRATNAYGGGDLKNMLRRCIEEANNPVKTDPDADADF